MATKLELVFKLIDQMSGPTKSISSKFADLNKQMEASRKLMKGMRSDVDGLSKSIKSMPAMKSPSGGGGAGLAGLSGGLLAGGAIGVGILGVTKALGAVKDIMMEIGSATYGVTKEFMTFGLQSAAYAETTLQSLKTLVGSEDISRKLLRDMVKFAAITPYSTAQVLDFTKMLVAGGFKPVEVPTMLKIMGDVGSIKGFDQQVMKRLMITMSQVKSLGKLQGAELRELNLAGVPRNLLYKHIAMLTGAPDGEAVAKMQRAGKITADITFKALEMAMAELGGGKLGGLMEAQQKTAKTLWSTLSSKPQELFMVLEQSTGFAAFKGAMESVINFIDNNAHRITYAVTQIFNGISKTLLAPFTSGNVDGFLSNSLDGIINAMTVASNIFRGAFAFVSGVMQGLFGGASKIIDTDNMERVIEHLSFAGRQFGELFASLPVMNFIDGLMKAVAGLSNVFTLLHGAVNALRTLLAPLMWILEKFTDARDAFIAKADSAYISGLKAISPGLGNFVESLTLSARPSTTAAQYANSKGPVSITPTVINNINASEMPPEVLRRIVSSGTEEGLGKGIKLFEATALNQGG